MSKSAVDTELELKKQYIALLKEKEQRIKYNYAEAMFPEEGPYSRDKYKKHIQFIKSTKDHSFCLFGAGNQIGKAQPISEPVLTPDGFRTMGDLRIGDKVIGSSGKPIDVIGVFPQGLRPVYKLTFSDGSVVRSDEEHLWTFAYSGRETYQTKPLSEWMKIKKNKHVPQRPCVAYPTKVQTIDPYLLGLLIGDGGLSQKSVIISSADKEIVDYCSEIASRYNTKLVYRSQYDYYFSALNRDKLGHWVNWLVTSIKELRLNCLSYYKFIPDNYLYGDEKQRKEILAGLMDSDGYVNKQGQMFYNTVSLELANNVLELTRSLGINSSIHRKSKCYEIYIPFADFPVFKLSRKLERQSKINKSQCVTLRNIEKVADEECVCIKVDSADSLYVTKDFILTHNTMTASYFIRTVATGKYPDWWEGRRWERPVSITIASVTPAQIRKAIQQKLFGRFSDLGTGMLSKEDLTDPVTGELMKWNMPGTSNTIGTAEVNHVSGGKSVIEVLTYQQGRDVFQGNTSDIVLFDEEPDHYSLYSEAVRSILRNNGLFLLTFTPLKGITPLLMNFLPNKDRYFEGTHPEHPHRCIIRAGIVDVPHFSQSAIEAAKSEYEPHLLEARLYGIPCMGMGSVYPIKEEDIVVAPFAVPEHWPRAYGMDFGWHNTAVAWITQNPSTGVYYVYDEYKRGQQAAYVHANAIKSRGKWIQGGCDPSGNRTEKDGSTYINDYVGLGLKITPGNNNISTGTGKIYNLMESGLFKIMTTCDMLLAEFRSYQFDINNPSKIKDEQDDHLLDAVRYGISVFPFVGKSKEDVYEEEHEQFYSGAYRGDDDIADDVTGY